jgi:hypothetical protein
VSVPLLHRTDRMTAAVNNPKKQRRLVGIDHGFSFPLQYFQENNLTLNWTAFLDDFQRRLVPR